MLLVKKYPSSMDTQKVLEEVVIPYIQSNLNPYYLDKDNFLFSYGYASIRKKFLPNAKTLNLSDIYEEEYANKIIEFENKAVNQNPEKRVSHTIGFSKISDNEYLLGPESFSQYRDSREYSRLRKVIKLSVLESYTEILLDYERVYLKEGNRKPNPRGFFKYLMDYTEKWYYETRKNSEDKSGTSSLELLEFLVQYYSTLPCLGGDGDFISIMKGPFEHTSLMYKISCACKAMVDHTKYIYYYYNYTRLKFIPYFLFNTEKKTLTAINSSNMQKESLSLEDMKKGKKFKNPVHCMATGRVLDTDSKKLFSGGTILDFSYFSQKA